MHRSGFVNIIGNPNVGKSTLMNALVGEKLSIITSKAQTTRHRIMGIVSGEDFQIVMVDRIGGDRSGTGDVIAAIIAGMYLNGHSLYESVKKAADYVSKCIRYCEENEVPSYWGLCFEMFMKDLTEEA